MSDKPKSVLQLKTQKKIQHILLEFFSKGEMSLGGQNFTLSINEVDISPNLRNLKVYVDISNMEEKNKKLVIKHLNEQDIYVIKKLLADKINLRYVPETIFILDESNAKLLKMEKLIKEEAKNTKNKYIIINITE